MTRGIKHSREEIISAIKAAWENGEDLRTNSVQRSKLRWTYRGHREYFSDWNSALEAAGTTYKQVKERVYQARLAAAKQEFLQELRTAYESGRELNGLAIQNSGDRGIYDRSKRFYQGRFGWETALQEAGLPLDKIVKQKRWDKERVKQRLIARDQEGKKLNVNAVKEDEHDLSKAIFHHFSSHDEALTYSGFKPEEIRKVRENYTPAEIVLEIIRLNSQGVNLNENGIIKGKNKSIKNYYYAARRRFEGGWAGAVKTAGIDYDKFRKKRPWGFWKRETVYSEIKALKDKGEPLNPKHISKKYSDLYHAATRYADGWESALKACDIEPLEIYKEISMSPEAIIAKIKELNNAGQDLSTVAMSSSENAETRRVFVQGSSKHGSWANALKKAGLNYAEIRKKVMRSLEEVITFVQQLELSGRSLSLQDMLASDDTRLIARSAQRRFDSWRSFLEAAGIDAEKYCTRTDWEEGKGIKKYLLENFPAGIVTGSTGDRNFAAAVGKYFDTISQAVETAGLIYSKSGRISRAQLEDPKVIGILYQCNKTFIEDIAKSASSEVTNRGLKKKEISELTNLGFKKLLEILPAKPLKQGLREFAYQQIHSTIVEAVRSTQLRDYDLILRAQTGDESAANQLIHNYERFIVWALPPRVRNDKDEVQEAGIDFWRAVTLWNPERDLELTTLAKTCIFTGFLKRRKARKTQGRGGGIIPYSLDTTLEDSDRTFGEHLNPENIPDQGSVGSSLNLSRSAKETREKINLEDRIADAISLSKRAGLTTAEKQIISFYLHGKSNQEIAEILETNSHSINTLLGYARNKMIKRRQLEESQKDHSKDDLDLDEEVEV